MKVLLVLIFASMLLSGLAVAGDVIDLSTLGKKKAMPTIEPVVLGASNPITYTPSFALGGSNITAVGGFAIYTPSIALSGVNINYSSRKVTVFTPAIALYGGA